MSVRKLYNAEANEDNTLVLHASQTGCCGEDGTLCGYFLDADISTGIAGIKVEIGSVEQTLTFDSVSTAKDVRLAIANALKSIGYDPYYDGDSFKGIIVNDDRIELISELKINSISVNGSYAAITQSCNPVRVSRLVGTITYNTEFTISDGTNTDAITAANAAALDTALDTWMTDSSIVKHKATEIVDAGGTGTFTIHVQEVDSDGITLDGVQITRASTYPSFKA